MDYAAYSVEYNESGLPLQGDYNYCHTGTRIDSLKNMSEKSGRKMNVIVAEVEVLHRKPLKRGTSEGLS